MAEYDLAWLTDAIAETFNQQDPAPNGLPPPRVAWTAVPPAPPPQTPLAAPIAADAAPPAGASSVLGGVPPHVAARARSEYKQWVEQWRLLLKREQLATNDVQQGVCELITNSKEIKEDEASRAKALGQLKLKLQEELWAIRGGVDGVKTQLVNVKPGPSYVAELSRKIEHVDVRLSDFKRWQATNITSLAEQEQQLLEEMEAAVFKIEDEVAAAARLPHPSSASTAKVGLNLNTQRRQQAGHGVTASYPSRSGPTSSSLAPEVIEFEEFLQKHGETGGWNPDDHAEFVNILKACGGDYTHAVKVTLEHCVGYSQRDVILHSRWHMDYTDLLVRKRMALAAWRAKRDQQRSKAQAQAALLETETATQAQAEHKVGASRDAEWEREQAVRREIVRCWKERREAALRTASEVVAEKQRAVQQQREAERAERQQLNKEKLELHKRAKEAMEREAAERRAANAPTPEERMSLAALSPQQAAAVALRNSEAQRRHQQLIASKEAAARERGVRQSKMLEKVHKEGTRDPGRLLRPTSAHQRRVQLTKAEEHAAKDSGFILTTSHKAPAPPLYKAAAGF